MKKAMILAAGKGERMRPLTNHTPKPLLLVNGKPLICWHLDNLAHHGFTDVVINNAWLGQKIIDYIGTSYKHMDIIHSSEPECLETAGGIAYAIENFIDDKDTPFLVINGDTFIPQLPLVQIIGTGFNMTKKQNDINTFLYLIHNPEHNPNGDFKCNGFKVELIDNIQNTGPSYTFSGVGIYRPSVFKDIKPGEHCKLLPILQRNIKAGMVEATLLNGLWMDIGTPERLQQVNDIVANNLHIV
jgi:N-acetyl-alpha-D-muramate 1-phosphate uridylyltransferase